MEGTSLLWPTFSGSGLYLPGCFSRRLIAARQRRLSNWFCVCAVVHYFHIWQLERCCKNSLFPFFNEYNVYLCLCAFSWYFRSTTLQKTKKVKSRAPLDPREPANNTPVWSLVWPLWSIPSCATWTEVNWAKLSWTSRSWGRWLGRSAKLSEQVRFCQDGEHEVEASNEKSHSAVHVQCFLNVHGFSDQRIQGVWGRCRLNNWYCRCVVVHYRWYVPIMSRGTVFVSVRFYTAAWIV